MKPEDSSDIPLPIPLEGSPEGPRDFTREILMTTTTQRSGDVSH